jgi:hypothetical protein
LDSLRLARGVTQLRQQPLNGVRRPVFFSRHLLMKNRRLAFTVRLDRSFE